MKYKCILINKCIIKAVKELELIDLDLQLPRNIYVSCLMTFGLKLCHYAICFLLKN